MHDFAYQSYLPQALANNIAASPTRWSPKSPTVILHFDRQDLAAASWRPQGFERLVLEVG
jgi:hypothetical protein